MSWVIHWNLCKDSYNAMINYRLNSFVNCEIVTNRMDGNSNCKKFVFVQS